MGRDYRGKGVNEGHGSRAGEGSEILASREAVAGTWLRVSEPRSLQLKGLSLPVEVVAVDWR